MSKDSKTQGTFQVDEVFRKEVDGSVRGTVGKDHNSTRDRESNYISRGRRFLTLEGTYLRWGNMEDLIKKETRSVTDLQSLWFPLFCCRNESTLNLKSPPSVNYSLIQLRIILKETPTIPLCHHNSSRTKSGSQGPSSNRSIVTGFPYPSLVSQDRLPVPSSLVGNGPLFGGRRLGSLRPHLLPRHPSRDPVPSSVNIHSYGGRTPIPTEEGNKDSVHRIIASQSLVHKL